MPLMLAGLRMLRKWVRITDGKEVEESRVHRHVTYKLHWRPCYVVVLQLFQQHG